MIEAATDTRMRRAIVEAHKARGQATREFWGWVFGLRAS